MTIIRPPFSNVTYGCSMTGKTTLWRRLLERGTVFEKPPTAYYIYGHLDLGQYDGLRDNLVTKVGENAVHVQSVQNLLPGTVFPRGALVFIDELNSALCATSDAKEKAALLGTVASIYNQQCHHRGLYVITLLQKIFGEKHLFPLLNMSQSLALSASTAQSVRVLRETALGEDMLPQARTLIRVLKKTNAPHFVFIYHNASALQPFLHRFIWAFCDMHPHFVLALASVDSAVGFDPPSAKQRKSAAANNAFEVATTRPVIVTMNDAAAEGEQAEAAAELENFAASAPEALKKTAFILVPMNAVRFGDKEDGEPAPSSSSSPPPQLNPMQELDKRVNEMMARCSSLAEVRSFRSIWHFLKQMPQFAIDDRGTVLYCRGHEVNLLSFLKTCSSRQPPPNSATAPKKKNKASVARLAECAPFVAELLADKTFPAHLIRNTRLLETANRLVLPPPPPRPPPTNSDDGDNDDDDDDQRPPRQKRRRFTNRAAIRK